MPSNDADPIPPASRFDAPEQSPGFLLWRVTLAWQRSIRAALSPHDLTHTQFVLLTSLWWIDGHGERAPTQRELADHAGTDPMMTSQVIRRLAERDLVRREADPRDARAHRLGITDAGRELVAAAIEDVEAADMAYFAPISTPERRAAFLQALGELTADADGL